MYRLGTLILVTSAVVSGTEDPRIPQVAPSQLPQRLEDDFERGKGGDVFAMIRANRWHYGKDVEVFPNTLIREKLEDLVKHGNPKAMVTLADIPPPFEPGQEERAWIQRRRKLLEQAAWLGEPAAMSRHARNLWQFDKNKEESRKWWIKGKQLWEERAKRGDSEAILRLAGYGGLPTDEVVLESSIYPDKERLAWMRLAAEIDSEAAYRYGQWMEVKDYKESTKWIEKAANDGYWLAMVQMARWWARGFPDGVDRKFDPATHPHLVKKTDAAKAWSWLDRAAGLVGWEMVSEQLTELGTDQFPKRPEKN